MCTLRRRGRYRVLCRSLAPVAGRAKKAATRRTFLIPKEEGGPFSTLRRFNTLNFLAPAPEGPVGPPRGCLGNREVTDCVSVYFRRPRTFIADAANGYLRNPSSAHWAFRYWWDGGLEQILGAKLRFWAICRVSSSVLNFAQRHIRWSKKFY